MRWVHIAVVALFGLITLIFLIQNREVVSMNFLSFGARMPLAVMAGIFYALGAITGGSLFALLMKSVRGSGIKPAA